MLDLVIWNSKYCCGESIVNIVCYIELLQFRTFNLKLEYYEKTLNQGTYLHQYIHGNQFIEILSRIISTCACLQLWRLNCVASVCLFLFADVESRHVSKNVCFCLQVWRAGMSVQMFVSVCRCGERACQYKCLFLSAGVESGHVSTNVCFCLQMWRAGMSVQMFISVCRCGERACQYKCSFLFADVESGHVNTNVCFCLQMWRVGMSVQMFVSVSRRGEWACQYKCPFLFADVESGHVNTNSAVRMLFRFMFRVMLRYLLRKLMVLQHIENLNAVSAVRGTSQRSRVAISAGILVP
jgi:hypothetical protein